VKGRGTWANGNGSRAEAEDAVQECWLRLDRSDPTGVVDLRGWLTTVVGRICIDVLRARRARPESPLGTRLPEPLVTVETGPDPQQHAVLADSVGLALLVVLVTLTPAERLAFVLHDVFAVPFEEIAEVVGRSPAAARQLASRARRRVHDAPRPDADLARQRRVVDAFLDAARGGDFAGLLAILDPDVVFRADLGPRRPARAPVVGAAAVARRVLATAPRFVHLASPAVVNGAAGALFGPRHDPVGVIGFTVAHGRIAAIDLIADPDTLHRLHIKP
jgi:RNA polymerase sigma-70 factor (ECF subfamily)